MHCILEQYIYNIILDLILPEMGFESKWVLRSAPLSIWSQIETFKVMSVKFISLALESKDEIKIPAGPE